ncbi:MAG: 2-keto-4-pentenoate hydratase [Rhodospirillaceae bacterium]|nr:2-keto-4-pentenoate hydratase [Rhodospirillaceae bacterium]|tara:strand:+ start:9661 stop:10575 length:915 start_codon:yes stop_codon:yes gene_type:complete
MAEFKLLNFAGVAGEARPGILVGNDQVIDLEQATSGADWARTTIDILNNWEVARGELHDLAENPTDTRPLADINLMAPLLYPPAIYCAGANYKKHAMEMSPDKKTYPDKSVTEPYFFLKNGPHCVIGPEEEIRLPALSNMVDWEAEFTVVIGKPGKHISVEKAFEHVAGYTILNDLSARDLGKREDWPRFGVDWFGHKNFETSAPMGPWIVPADQIEDPYECRMKLWVNEDEMQNEVIADLIFDIAEQIEWVSRRFTLLPGDVFSTGTPSGVGRPRGIFLKPGDIVRINVDGIGELKNPVVQGD